MNLFHLTQIIPIVPKFKWKCFNYPNSIEAVGIYPLVSDCIQISMKPLYITQTGMKLFEVTQIWMKQFHLPQIWMGLLLFAERWFSVLEFFAKYFQIMEI